MALLQGTNSYFILGNDQADWETRSTTAIQKVFNFISEEVVPGFEVYRFERNKGFPVQPRRYRGLAGKRSTADASCRYASGNDIEMDNRRQFADDHHSRRWRDDSSVDRGDG